MDNPQKVKDWIKEVIQQNNLAGIIFMWDEFTDFFIHNVAVTSLQELAQATGEFPFYLFLITHRSPEHFQRLDEQTRKKLLERFHNFHLEMAPVTAYQLMANAIDVKKDVQGQWDIRKESLWSRVEKTTIRLLGDEGRKDDFKGLIPVHPYAAYLLATITRQFSSSQRTLFKFLKEEDEYSFNCFLKNYPRHEWYWFTADILWDYFFRDDNPELTERIRDIIGYYRSRCEQIENEDEQRVFKVLMLLIALWRQMPEGSRLLRPLRTNLEITFTATPVAERLNEIVHKLRVKELIHSLFSGSEEEYTLPLVNIDERKLDDFKKQVLVTSPFERVIGNNGEIGSQLLKIFTLHGAARRRQVLNIVSVKDLKFKRARVQPDLKPYEIGNVLVVVQEEEQMQEAETLSATLAKETERTAYIVIQAPFMLKRWEDWIDKKARQRYCLDMRDMENAKFYSQQLEGLVQRWLSIVTLVKHKAYFGGQVMEITAQSSYEDYFRMLVERIYPCGPEQLSVVNTLYDERFGKVGAEVGLGIKTPYEPYTSLVNELKKQGFWSGDGFQRYPEHPLSRAKQEVDNFFTQKESVNMSEIWQRLQAPPYGLLPSPIAITLMGVLLRDYVQGYYWYDGPNCFSLNPNKMAELIENTMKEKKSSQEYEIRRVSPEGEQFCQLLQEIFNLLPEMASYPEEARKALCNYFTKMGYPIWSLLYIPAPVPDNDSAINDAISELQAILSVSTAGTPDLSGEQLKAVVGALTKARQILKEMLQKGKFVAGMNNFIAAKIPDLPRVMEELKMDFPSLMHRLKLMMNEEIWLWDKAKVEERLPELYAELELVNALNQLCAAQSKQLEEAVDYFSQEWLKKAGKLPLSIIEEAAPEPAKRIIHELKELVSCRGKGYHSKLELARQLKDTKEEVRQAINCQKEALMTWIKRSSPSQEITPQEAEEIYNGLPDLRQQANLDVILSTVRSQLDSLGRRKLYRELKAKWEEITGCESPDAWSKKNKIPIYWVLNDQNYRRLLELVHRAETKPVAELQQALEFLQVHAEGLTVLKDHQFIKRKFIAAVAGEYNELLKEDGVVEELKNHLFSTLGQEVLSWPHRIPEVKNAVRNWMENYYQHKAYRYVLTKIEAMPEERVKGLLKKLAQDPLVGNLLLQP